MDLPLRLAPAPQSTVPALYLSSKSFSRHLSWIHCQLSGWHVRRHLLAMLDQVLYYAFILVAMS